MSELGNFIAFQAAVSLIKQHGQARLLEEVYKACKEELTKPREERRNWRQGHLRRLDGR